MFEKVNPKHPDKIADRIAGAIVDLAYKQKEDPKIAVEVLIGHGECNIIIECDNDLTLSKAAVQQIVNRISDSEPKLNLKVVSQDVHLAANQNDVLKCGDNGIFKGMPVTDEQKRLTSIAYDIYEKYNSDGKYIIDADKLNVFDADKLNVFDADKLNVFVADKLIICQSKAGKELNEEYVDAKVNPLGYWTGGIDVDSGATNRKLGSDMGDAVTGGGLHGKDLSKADVTVNIYCHILANKLGKEVKACCAIGDEEVLDCSYEKMIKIVKEYIKDIGGFEKLAEWGLIRP